jgi:hypothetical protein
MAGLCYVTPIRGHKAYTEKEEEEEQKHSNCLKCPPWNSMHFSALISSDWVA